MVGIRRLRFVLLLLLPLFVSCQTVDTSSDPRQWGEPERLESLASGAKGADVAIDPTGNALAVWDQTDPSNLELGAGLNASDDIWLNRPDDTGRWGDARLLEQTEPDDSVSAQIGIDGDGSAFVAFLQSPGVESDGFPYRVWAVRYAPDEDFSERPRCIQSTADDSDCSQLGATGHAGPPQLALDADGNAVVIWHQEGDEGGGSGIWFNRFAPDSGWLGAEAVDPSGASDFRPAIAIDADGNAIAVWERLDQGVSSIWSRRLPRSGEREESQQVEVDNGDAFVPRVAVDPAGNAVAVWVQRQTSDAPFSTRSNHWPASRTRWGEAQPIGIESADDEAHPQIVMDGDGNAIAIWAQIGGAREGIWSNRYAVDVGWETTAVPVGPRNLGPARTPQIAVNLYGDAVAVWVQFDSVRDSIWSNRYTPNQGWTVSESIENNDPTRATGPQVAVDGEGNAVALWTDAQGQLDLDLWANRLSAKAPGSDTR